MYLEYTPSAVYPDTGYKLQLDIFIPAISLAIEYHGAQHYVDAAQKHQMESSPTRDNDKQEICKKLGITLITVPFWWDRDTDSIAATIHAYRPDLIPSPPPNSKPIPTEMPPKFKKKISMKIHHLME